MSEMIEPSLISMTRLAKPAMWWSWVTTMMVCPRLFSSVRMSMTFSPLLESSAPVGSSARMMLPPFMSARAMETRCCWPPESSLGLFSSLSGRPRSASRDLARSRRAFLSTPEYTAGRATFSVADSVESRL